MTRRYTLGVLVLAGALVVVSTGGMSASSLHRSADGEVVSDDRAYVGVQPVDQSLDPGHHKAVTLLELENRFGTPLTEVSVAVDDDGRSPTLRSYETPRTLDPGDSTTVTGTIVCDAGDDSPDTETWALSIEVSGANKSVELTRSVTVTCERPTPRASNASNTPS